MSNRRIASRFLLRQAFDSKQWGPFRFEIDRPKGFLKTWDLPDGSQKSYEYPVDYGYFIGHTGEDDEGLDAFVGSDPAAPIESFLKLMPGPDGTLIPDETKFLVGLTEEERQKVMALYKPEEVVAPRVYVDFYDLLATLNTFRDRKKANMKVATMARTSLSISTRVGAPKVLTEEQITALMEKVRKGSVTSFSFVQTKAVIEALGGSVEPVVGVIPLERDDGGWYHLSGRDGPDALANRDKALAEIRQMMVSSIPSNPKIGVLYVTDVKPWEGHSGYVGIELKGGYGSPAFEVKLGSVHEIVNNPYARPEKVLGQLSGNPPPKPKDIMMSSYVLPGWMATNTDWAARAAKYLSREEHQPGVPRTAENTGTCGYCFRNVKLKNGVTVLHGYLRPGHGSVEGQCTGRNLPPFELSVQATEIRLKEILQVLKNLNARLDALQSGETQSLPYGRNQTIEVGNPAWPGTLRTTIERVKYEIENAQGEREVFDDLVNHWKVRPLPVEGEYQINWFVQGRKASTASTEDEASLEDAVKHVPERFDLNPPDLDCVAEGGKDCPPLGGLQVQVAERFLEARQGAVVARIASAFLGDDEQVTVEDPVILDYLSDLSGDPEWSTIPLDRIPLVDHIGDPDERAQWLLEGGWWTPRHATNPGDPCVACGQPTFYNDATGQWECVACASVQMGRTADMSPPLGGGPCRVVDRILNTVRDPKVRDQMVEDVQKGNSLANEESRKVYPFSREHGSFFKTFTIVPHAAYRMDWREVGVKDIVVALNSFAYHMKSLKEKRDPAYERTLTQTEIAWIDPKTKLQIVFGVAREGDVKVISAFWKGVPDPRPTVCDVARVAARFLESD